jgi:hypothetical protein
MTVADDFAGSDIEGGEERRRAVPDVVMRPPRGDARTHLIDAQHRRVIRWLQIEADDTRTFSTNCGSADNLGRERKRSRG